jgi:hypothetical protein
MLGDISIKRNMSHMWYVLFLDYVQTLIKLIYALVIQMQDSY